MGNSNRNNFSRLSVFLLSLITSMLLVAGAYGALVGELQANKAKIEDLQKRVYRQEEVLAKLQVTISEISSDVKVIKAMLRKAK